MLTMVGANFTPSLPCSPSKLHSSMPLVKPSLSMKRELDLLQLRLRISPRDYSRRHSLPSQHIGYVARHSNISDYLDSNGSTLCEFDQFAKARQPTRNVKFQFGLHFPRNYRLPGRNSSFLLQLNHPNHLAVEHPLCSNTSCIPTDRGMKFFHAADQWLIQSCR